MLKFLFALFCFVFGSHFANAAVFVGGGAGVTEGVILEGGVKMNPFLSFRARGGYMPSVNLKAFASGFESGGKSDGFGKISKADFNSKVFDIGAEVTPFPVVPVVRGIKLIGAMQYMNTGIDVATNYNGNVNFNGMAYNVDGGIDFRLQNKQKFAPYFAIGWDVINLPIITARITAGATNRSFDARITGIRGNVEGTVGRSNIDAEFAKVQKDVNKKMWVPSVSLTVRATLPSIPFI